MTKAQRLAARELKLVEELQRNHDWMFFELPKKDRRSMMFKRSIVKGKSTQSITAARRVMVAFPATSPIAKAFDLQEKSKSKRGAK